MLDFIVRDFGSLLILDPLNDRSEDWAVEHLKASVMRWGRGFVIEPRYLSPIIEGLLEEGFELEDDAVKQWAADSVNRCEH